PWRPAPLRRERSPTGPLALGADRSVLDVLDARVLVRDGAHVAPALDVVLPARGVQPRAVSPDVPAEQREIDERQHVVDRVVMLGYSERPAQLSTTRLRVGMAKPADRLGRHDGQ